MKFELLYLYFVESSYIYDKFFTIIIHVNTYLIETLTWIVSDIVGCCR
jgi:hypothetical protein